MRVARSAARSRGAPASRSETVLGDQLRWRRPGPRFVKGCERVTLLGSREPQSWLLKGGEGLEDRRPYRHGTSLAASSGSFQPKRESKRDRRMP